MRKTLTLLAFATALGVSGHALASGDDDAREAAANDKWLATSVIKSKLGELGYSVRKIEAEDGRYEVKATDKQGARVKLYVNPLTGEIEKPAEAGKERS